VVGIEADSKFLVFSFLFFSFLSFLFFSSLYATICPQTFSSSDDGDDNDMQGIHSTTISYESTIAEDWVYLLGYTGD